MALLLLLLAAGTAGECQADADCALTRVAEGACCAMLCAPRVVTARRAQELRQKSARCGRPCPHPLCRPPRESVTPACLEHRCTARRVKPKN